MITCLTKAKHAPRSSSFARGTSAVAGAAATATALPAAATCAPHTVPCGLHGDAASQAFHTQLGCACRTCRGPCDPPPPPPGCVGSHVREVALRPGVGVPHCRWQPAPAPLPHPQPIMPPAGTQRPRCWHVRGVCRSTRPEGATLRAHRGAHGREKVRLGPEDRAPALYSPPRRRRGAAAGSSSAAPAAGGTDVGRSGPAHFFACWRRLGRLEAQACSMTH